MTARIAFHAPLKGPDHPAPSGDRTVGRLYRRALELAGYEVETVSDLRCFDGTGDPLRQQAILAAAAAEQARLMLRPAAARPALWFTYHCHYKAPDLIGPALAAAWNVPYVIAEPSFSRRRAFGPWADFHAASARAILAADIAITATMRDHPAVAALRGERPTLHLPPFLDVGVLPEATRRTGEGPTRLVTVAMMRPGDKLASYRMLAAALAHLSGDWHLTLIGDGAARAEVEALFAPHAEQITFCGAIDQPASLAGVLGASDVMVWPAVNEAYGMALLEAQAMGLPVVAGRGLSVADVVKDRETGLLVETGDIAGLAQAVQRLIDAPDVARAMGRRARDFATSERSLGVAAPWLGRVIEPLLEARRCAC
jgi:glycosyltransferase involved in cell wall biosynthesis